MPHTQQAAATISRIARAALAVASLLIAACAGDPPRVDDSVVARGRSEDPGCSAASLERGRQLYLDHCDSCHALYLPDSRPSLEWPHELTIMAPKAHLARHDANAILMYVLAAHTPAPGNRSAP